MALFPPLVPPHGAFGEPGPCWAVETSSGTPEARFLGEAETASHQACTHVFHAPWAAPRPPRPPERCVFGGGRCRAEIQGPLPLVWRERGVPHLRLCLSSSESASWGAAPLLLGMKWRRRPAEAAVRWVFVGGRVQRATRASPLRLSLLASAPFL